MEINIPSLVFGFANLVPRKLESYVVETMKTAKKVGQEDPRRVVHAIKVGLGLTIVSLFYYFRPLYEGFGQAGMWAILTVVVVFEYTVGGTLSKSLNRGFATLVAGALGLGAEYLADLCGDKGEPVVLGLLVFFLAATSTFTRFFPNVKRRYDYGVLIFILTFTMVAVSGFRVGEILQLAHQRLSTIVIGGAVCMAISIFVCPVWAGQDLHNLVFGNFEKLATFLEGFGAELLLSPGEESGETFCKKDEKPPFLQSYKSVINSKANEESLSNFAWWEPPHGNFKFRHPWKQYLKIGALVRECCCLIEPLNSYISSKSQAKVVSSELQMRIQKPIAAISTECGKALRELATAVKQAMRPSLAVEAHVQNYRSASQDLKAALEDAPRPSDSKSGHLHQIMPLLVIASVLVDLTGFVDEILLAVDEFSEKARFGDPKLKTPPEKQQQMLHRGIVNPVDDDCVVVVEIREDDGGGGLPEKSGSRLPE